MSLENFEFSGNKFDKNLKDNLKINNELVELAYQIVNWFLIKPNCLDQISCHSGHRETIKIIKKTIFFILM